VRNGMSNIFTITGILDAHLYILYTSINFMRIYLYISPIGAQLKSSLPRKLIHLCEPRRTDLLLSY
jgi:hypothetical protein